MPFQSKNRRNHQQSQYSSSLMYLKQNQNNDDQMQNQNDKPEGDDSKMMDSYNNSRVYQQFDSRRRERDLLNESSYGQKIVLNNRRKEKYIQSHPNAEGVFLYKPKVEFPNLDQFINQPIKVIIAAEYITKENSAILDMQIYGNDMYTVNSDCVCIGIHSGLFSLSNFTRNTKKYMGLQINMKVLKSKRNYNGCLRNGILSKPINDYNGNLLKPESHKFLQNMEPQENLLKYASNMNTNVGNRRKRPKPVQLSQITPMPQSHLIFNCNRQPAFKYSLVNISDKGYDKSYFLVRKLDTQVLYVQTKKQQKYQIFKSNFIDKSATQNNFFQVYRISKVKDPLLCDNAYFEEYKAPLDIKLLQVIYESLEWQDMIWKNSSLTIKDKTIQQIDSFKLYPKSERI